MAATGRTDITAVLVEEHRLILRMVALVEARAAATANGEYRNYGFYLDAVDFIRNYADRFHHAKEEDVLFAALVRNGMPLANSPVAAMLVEHDQGRAFVRGMEEAARAAGRGESGQDAVIAENARGYAALLRDHIAKEDDILYPLAERVLPEEVRPAMNTAYAAAEAALGAGLSARYTALVEKYEQEGLRVAC